MATSKFAMSQFAALSAAAECDALAPEVREVLAHMAAQKAAQSAAAKTRKPSPSDVRKSEERAKLDASIFEWAQARTAEDADFAFASIDATRALGGATDSWQRFSSAISRLREAGKLVAVDAKGKHLYRVA